MEQERLTAIFRLFQEALAHATKHAHATEVLVTLNTENRMLHLQVKDNGETGKPGRKSKAKALRIVTMQERALFLGGELTITEKAGAGTLVSVKIPFQAPHHRRA